MKPITLDDQPLFERYLSQYPPTVSELTFADIFCRTELRHFLYCEYEGHLLVSFRSSDSCFSLLAPVGPHPERIIRENFDGLCRYTWARIDEELAGKLQDLPLQFDRENSDYLYSLEELRTLAGKKYDGKRNFIKRMAKLNPQVRELSKESALDCIRVQEEWLEGQQDNPTARDESTAFMKAMQHFGELALRGIGVFVEEKLIGFAIGESLNPTTYVEHFEKGLSDYIGIYPFLLNAFAKAVPAPFTLLNREQDKGIEGLRKSKESWNPTGLVKKYTWAITCDHPFHTEGPSV
jgi:hypothetical protein